MRQGTSRIIVIGCSENFFYFLNFETVFPDFGIFWHIIHFTHLQFSLCNSFWSRFSMPITNPRGRQNVKIIRITNHRTGSCFWWEKIEQMLWISSKCYLFKGKCYPKDIFAISVVYLLSKTVIICFVHIFYHKYSFPSPSAGY